MRCSLPPSANRRMMCSDPAGTRNNSPHRCPQSGRSPPTLGGTLLDCALRNGLDGVYGIEGYLAAKSQLFAVRAETSAQKHANQVAGWPSGN